MLTKPKKYIIFGGLESSRGSQQQSSTSGKPRNDMDKRRFSANCGPADHHVADCTSYKLMMKSLGNTPDEDDIN